VAIIKTFLHSLPALCIIYCNIVFAEPFKIMIKCVTAYSIYQLLRYRGDNEEIWDFGLTQFVHKKSISHNPMKTYRPLQFARKAKRIFSLISSRFSAVRSICSLFNPIGSYHNSEYVHYLANILLNLTWETVKLFDSWDSTSVLG
jgi:hypothetical protein